jgi:hypothetical protein
MPDAAQARTSERDEILAIHDKHRGLFLVTVRGLTDEQARLTPTASTLSLGGLVKHAAATVGTWLDFVERGAPEGGGTDWEDADPAVVEAYANGFRLTADETLEGVLAAYADVHARLEGLVRSVDLDAVHALPVAPWFTPGEAWSNRRVFMHVLAETAQHAGHADILRESIDGQRSMG